MSMVKDKNGDKTHISLGLFYKITNRTAPAGLNVFNWTDKDYEAGKKWVAIGPDFGEHSQWTLVSSGTNSYKIVNRTAPAGLNIFNWTDKEYEAGKKWVAIGPDFGEHSEWFFKPQSYKLTAKICQFEYDNPLEVLERTAQPVDLIAAMHFHNDGNAELTQKIDQNKKVETKACWNFRESQSTNFSDKFTVSVEASAGFLGFGVKASTENIFTWNTNSTFERHSSYEVKETVSHHIEQTIKIPPHSRVDAVCTMKFAKNLAIPFKAKVIIIGEADQMIGGKVEHSQVNREALESLLSAENYIGNVLSYEGNSAIAEVAGTFIGDVGLSTTFSTTDVPLAQ